MNRRELIKSISILTGVALVGSDVFLTGCKSRNDIFTETDISFFDEVAETILPKTDTPGAKDAEVGAFIATYAAGCYDKIQQDILKQGIVRLNEAASKKYNKGFTDISKMQKEELLTLIHAEARSQSGSSNPSPHYFTLMMQLTLLGFFTSRPGATQVLRYLPVPGTYQGCLDYKGEASWA